MFPVRNDGTHFDNPPHGDNEGSRRLYNGFCEETYDELRVLWICGFSFQGLKLWGSGLGFEA